MLVRVEAMQNGALSGSHILKNMNGTFLLRLISLWFSAVTMPLALVHSQHWYPVLSFHRLLLLKMVTFIDYKLLYHNSDSLNGS